MGWWRECTEAEVGMSSEWKGVGVEDSNNIEKD